MNTRLIGDSRALFLKLNITCVKSNRPNIRNCNLKGKYQGCECNDWAKRLDNMIIILPFGESFIA